MRKLIRVTISACLVLTMVLSLLPMSVIAAEEDELQAALSENQQTLFLPIVNEGDDAPPPQGYSISAYDMMANTEGYTYTYVGVDNVVVGEDTIINDSEGNPVTEDPAPAANGLLQIVDGGGNVLASSEAISSYNKETHWDSDTQESVFDYWYVSYQTISGTQDIPAGTYDLQLSAGNEVYPCSGAVVVVGADDLLITDANAQDLYAGADTFEVYLHIYGFETENELTQLSFELADDGGTTIAASTGAYRDISANSSSGGWYVYAQMQVADGPAIVQNGGNYSLKISYGGTRTLVDGVGAVGVYVSAPSVSIEGLQVTDAQTGAVTVTLKDWSDSKSYRVTVSENYDGAEYGSWEGSVPTGGAVPVQLTLNGMTMPMTSYGYSFYVQVYEGDQTYCSDSEQIENPYYNLYQESCYFYPYYIKPAATQVPFTIESHNCSYMLGEGDVLSMRDGSGTEVGGCASLNDERDGSSGTLSGTLSITGSLTNKQTYYLFLNGVQFDTVYVTDALAMNCVIRTADTGSDTFWMNLGIFPVSIDAINSGGSGSIVVKDSGGNDVLTSGDLTGTESEYYEHLHYEYTFTAAQFAGLTSGAAYNLVFRDAGGTEKTLYGSALTYVTAKTPLSFSNSSHANILWYDAAPGDMAVTARLYLGSSNGPKNITDADLEAAVTALTLSDGSDAISVTGYRNAVWTDDGYNYNVELMLSAPLTAGSYTLYSGGTKIGTFTIQTPQSSQTPQVYSADAAGGYVHGVNLPEDGAYTGKLYSGYTCLSSEAFPLTWSKDSNDNIYLLFSRTLLSGLDAGEYEIRVYWNGNILGSADLTIAAETEPIITVNDDDDDWNDAGDTVMNCADVYIGGANMGAYGYLRWAETEDALAEANFSVYFSNRQYSYSLTGTDGPKTLYVELSKDGSNAADNLIYSFNLWLCTDGDYDLQVPESIQGIQNQVEGTYTITATTELPATNVWAAFCDADGGHATRQMSYTGTSDGRYEFSLSFNVEDCFYDYYSYGGEFDYINTQSIRVFATDLSGTYNQNEAYSGNIVGEPVERVLVFGNPDYIILPQFANGEVLTNQTGYNVIGYATPGSEVTVSQGAEPLGTANANGYGYFSAALSDLSEGSHTLTVSDSGGISSQTDAMLTVDTTAPVIGSIGFTFLTGGSAVVHWTCTDTDVDYFQIYKNAALLGRAAADTSSYNVVAAANDGNTFTVKAIDKAGNVGEGTASTADTEAPAAPDAAPTASVITTTGMTLTWTAGTDNMGVAGYNIYQDGVKDAETTGEDVLTYAVTDLAQGTEYSFTVKTRDRAGNLSDASAALTVSTVALTLSSPDLKSGYIVDEYPDKRIPVAFTVSADTQDYQFSLAGARLEYRPNDAQEGDPWSSIFLNCSGTGASGNWIISGSEDGYLPMGDYQVRFCATDNAGAQVVSDPVNVVLLKRDDEAPTIPGTPVADSHSTTSITFHWEASTDNVAVDHYEIYRDGVKVAEPVAASYTDTGLAMGEAYAYTVKAVDARGNASDSSASASLSTMSLAFDSVISFGQTYTMEEQADKSIDIWARFQPEEGYAPDVTMAMEYQAGGQTDWTSVALPVDKDDANLFAGTWPLDGTDDGYLPAGSYSVRFAVTDGSATAYSDTQTVSLQRDAEKPVMNALTPTSGTYGGKSIIISASATDNVGVVRIELSYASDGNNTFTSFGTLTSESEGEYETFGGSYTWDASGLASGSYTIKAVAYDRRGNESEARTGVIIIDNTPPDVPGDFIVTGTSRYIHVMWDSSYQAPVDFRRFNVYRSTSENGEFSRVGGGTSIGYFDDGETAAAGTTYYYYVTAEDTQGNESAATIVLSANLVADNESPTIGDMLPRANASVRKSVTLSVTAADNYRLAKAVFEYRASGTQDWTNIAEVPVADVTNNTTFRCTWDISALAAGTYEIRAGVYDDSINDVEAGSGYTANAPATLTRTVTIMAYSLPVAPVVSVDSGYKTAALSWTYSGNTETLKQFEIYKTDAGGENRTYVTTVKAAATGSYTAAIPAAGAQYFVVAARDDYDAYAYSTVTSVTSAGADTIAPVAVILPETLVAGTDTAFAFSGAGSTDNDAIASYSWNFGDGTTGTGKTCSHTYSSAGTYTVTLIVTDECGNPDMATAAMTVYDVTGEDAAYALMTISVVNGYEEGTPAVAGAAIKVYNDKTPGSEGYFETTTLTDAGGQATLVVPIGNCTVSATADGFVSAARAVTVEPEDDGTFACKIGLASMDASTVGGSLTSTEMTYDEILAAGIDVTDPDNEHVWKFAVKFHFVAGPALPFDLPVTAYYNQAGDFVGGSGWGWFSLGGGSGWGGMNIGVFPISENFVLVVYGEAHWLKEMYNVELLVINNSYIDDITDCMATLDLPEGLSLAAMTGDEQTAAIDLGTIGHKASADGTANTAKATWYVRGDAEGSYNLTATVTGNNPSPFIKTFTTDKPLKVYAGSALHLTITAEDVAYRGDEYHVQFKLENVSDKDLYNLSFGITGAEQFKVLKIGSATGELPLTQEDFGDGMTQSVDVLEPGGSITIDFSTTTWFNSALELADLGPLDVGYYLTDVFVTTLEGSTTEIPYTVNIVHSSHGSFFEWLLDEAKDFVTGKSIDLMDEDFAGEVGLLKNGVKVYKFLTTDTTDAGSTAVITVEGGYFTSSNNFLRSFSLPGSSNVNAIAVYTDADEANYSISPDGSTLTLQGSANIYVDAEAAGQAIMTATTQTYDSAEGSFVPNTYKVNFTVSGDEGAAQRVVLQEPAQTTVAVPLAGSGETKITFPYVLLDANGNYLYDDANASWTVTGDDTTGLSVEKGVLTIVSNAKGGDYTVKLALSESEYAEQSITLTRSAAQPDTVRLYRNGIEISNADTLVVPVTDTTGTYTYTAELLDQYGVPMPADFEWAVSNNTSGVTPADGVVSLTKYSALGALTLTASSGGKSASVTVTITNLSVDWSDVDAVIDAAAYTYGDANDKAVLPESGTATALETVTGTFSYAEGSVVQGAGTKTITVIFTADENSATYAGVTLSKDYTVVIAPRPITMTVDMASKVYGAAANPDFAAQVTTGSLVTGDTVAGLGLGLSCAADATSGVGTYDIVGDGVYNENYTVTVNGAGKLSVTPKKLDVTAENILITKVYDGSTTAGAISGDLIFSAISGDDVTVMPSAPQAYSAAGVGNVYSVGFTATLNGSDAANYTLGEETATRTATASLTVFDAAITAKPLSQVTVAAISARNYTGGQIKPEPAVSFAGADGTITLTSGTDFTCSYGTNTDCAEGLQDGSVTITAKDGGNYSGSQTVTFDITPATATLSILSGYGRTYNAAPIDDPAGSQVSCNLDLNAVTVTYRYYSGADCQAEIDAPTDAGTYWVKGSIDAGTNHTGVTSTAKQFTIDPKPLSEVSVGDIASQTYAAGQIKPEPTVTFAGIGDTVTLNAAVDFAYSYGANINCVSGSTAEGRVTVTAVNGGNYTGSKSVTFDIAERDLSTADVASVTEMLSYDGSAKTPKPAVTWTRGAEDVVTLTAGADFTYSYARNINAGNNAAVTVTGCGNYTGTAGTTFTILPKDISAQGSGVTVSDIPDQTYSGSELTPIPAVKDGSNVLSLGSDYRLEYANNINAAEKEAATAPTMLITGIGNYSGTLTSYFTIQGKAVTGTVSISGAGDDDIFNPGDQLTLTRSADVPAGGTVTWYDAADSQLGAGEVYTISDSDVSKRIHAVYTAPANHTGTLTAAAVEVGKKPLSGSLSLTVGPVNVGDVAALTSSNINGAAPTTRSDDYTLQWLRDGKPISGAAGLSYTITAADRGCSLSVCATAKGDTYTGTLVSAGVGVNTQAPSVSLTATSGDGQAVLRWTTDNGGSDITKYIVYIKSGTDDYGAGLTLAADTTSYTFTGLTNGTRYTFKVEAYNTSLLGEAQTGEGETSATPAAPSGGIIGGGGTDAPTVTVPMVGDTAAVETTVTIVDSTASVEQPSDAELNAVIDSAKNAGTPVRIDLSALSGPLTTIKLPAAMVSEIAKAGTGLEICLPDGSGFTMTGPALTEAAENGGELSVSISPVTIASLPANEQTALEGQTVLYTFDVMVKNGGTEMHQLGGFAEITFALGTQYAGRLVDVLHIEDGTAVSAVVATGLLADSDGRVTIKVSSCSTFAVVSSSQLPFTDVATGKYYYDAVVWAIEKAVTRGTSPTAFSPDAACNRAQTVTFLWRAMGSPEPTATVSPFTDVSADAYYYKAVLWAVENGVTSGTSATTFSPDATVTRAQTVTFLWRSAGQPAADGPYGDFGDVEQGAYYETAVSWAAENGITGGTGEGMFSPSASCTRGQIVTFLYRHLGK